MMNLPDSPAVAPAPARSRRIYPKLGGDLAYACQRLASGLRVPGIVIVLFRGDAEAIEVAASFRDYLNIGSKAFRDLAKEILKDAYSASLTTASEGCLMFAEATGAKSVTIFRIGRNGGVRIEVSGPTPKELVATYVAQMATDLDARN